jgi:hypothetical protein
MINARSRSGLLNSFEFIYKENTKVVLFICFINITYFYLQWIAIIQVLFYNLDSVPLSNQPILYGLFHLSIYLPRLF